MGAIIMLEDKYKSGNTIYDLKLEITNERVTSDFIMFTVRLSSGKDFNYYDYIMYDFNKDIFIYEYHTICKNDMPKGYSKLYEVNNLEQVIWKGIDFKESMKKPRYNTEQQIIKNYIYNNKDKIVKALNEGYVEYILK